MSTLFCPEISLLPHTDVIGWLTFGWCWVRSWIKDGQKLMLKCFFLKWFGAPSFFYGRPLPYWVTGFVLFVCNISQNMQQWDILMDLLFQFRVCLFVCLKFEVVWKKFCISKYWKFCTVVNFVFLLQASTQLSCRWPISLPNPTAPLAATSPFSSQIWLLSDFLTCSVSHIG